MAHANHRSVVLKSKGQGIRFLALFFIFIFGDVLAAPLSRDDLRSFARYYVGHGRWVNALEFTKKLIEQEDFVSEDIALHLHASWELGNQTPEQRKNVTDVLMELKLYSDEPWWNALWTDYTQRIVRKETIQKIATLQSALQKKNCAEAPLLIDSVNPIDGASHRLKMMRLATLKECVAESKAFDYWVEAVTDNPFSLDLVQFISGSTAEVLIPHVAKAIIQINEKWEGAPRMRAYDVLVQFIKEQRRAARALLPPDLFQRLL